MKLRRSQRKMEKFILGVLSNIKYETKKSVKKQKWRMSSNV